VHAVKSASLELDHTRVHERIKVRPYLKCGFSSDFAYAS